MIHRYLYFWVRRYSVANMRKKAKYCRQVQHKLLLQKLHRHADSDFGKQHGFSKIKTLQDFRRQCPLTEYEYYRSYIDRVKNGELTAMFNPGTRVLMFAMTSGTTDKSKYLPVTRESFMEYRLGWTLWGIALHWEHKDLIRKRILKLASNWSQQMTPAGIPCGNISGLVSEAAPLITHSRFVLPSAVYRLDNPDAKHYTALRLALAARDVGMLGTANPSTLIHFAQQADKHRERLIKDVHDGTLDFEIPDAIRKKLNKHIISAQPQRAKELEAIIEKQGVLYPQHIWPGLSVLAVWTGGSVAAYLPKLKDYYGNVILRDHGLNASEGRMTIPLQDGSCAGMLEYFNHFFEFIPIEEHDSKQPTFLEAHELEEGKDYYIVLTTSAGLYRYDIHDVVRCVGFVGNVPTLQFLNKGAHFSSITGEKLSEYQIVTAVSKSLNELKLSVDHFTVAPVMSDPPGYVLLLEDNTVENQLEALPSKVDSELQRLNWEYSEKRSSGRLQPLQIKMIPQGTWHSLRKAKTAERGNLEEYKHPCLVGDLEFIANLEQYSPQAVI